MNMREARMYGSNELRIAYERTWSVITHDGETDKAAIEREELARGRAKRF